jgi:hypothetical protein
MPKSTASVIGNIIREPVVNLRDATNMSGEQIVAAGLCASSLIVFAPHLLMVNGVLSLLGSAGRGANDLNTITDDNGEPLKLGKKMSIDEFLAHLEKTEAEG